MLEVIGYIALIILVLLTFIVVYKIYIDSKKREGVYFKSCEEKELSVIDFKLDEDNVIYESNLNYAEGKFLENFNYTSNDLIDMTYKIFKALLLSRDEENIGVVRKFLSDDLYNKYKNQILDNTVNNRKRIFKNIKLYKGIVEDFYNQNADIVIYMSYSDYLIDTNTKEVIRGTKNEKLHVIRFRIVVNIDSFLLIRKQKIFEKDLNDIL